jgi:hypothetical protein
VSPIVNTPLFVNCWFGALIGSTVFGPDLKYVPG